ncbi:hypothetical protein EV360DRAFT_82672 [Lentinula raphanica]|nr:hypothetical protein EV360DRAFT_82672 [Lentinula raphanica]
MASNGAIPPPIPEVPEDQKFDGGVRLTPVPETPGAGYPIFPGDGFLEVGLDAVCGRCYKCNLASSASL